MNVKTIIILFLLIFIGVVSSQDLTGEDIIQKVNEIFNPQTSQGIAKMTIVTSSGSKRTFVYETYSKDEGEKNLVRYLEPRRAKGQATLMLNHANDIWMYFPRTQRIRKLATHAKKQKMEGSDFSYEDMGSGDAFIDDFMPKRMADEKIEGYECFKLELMRKPESDISYSRLIMWIIKENFYPIVIDYYEEDNLDRKEKRLVQSNIKIIDNIPTAMKAVMYNENDNTQTELELVEVKYNVPLNDDMFTERALKK